MDELKQYFLQTINKIGEINEVDEFAQLMLNIIKNGNVEINFKRFTETKVFDELWIKTFESYFVYLDNIIRNPWKILAEEEEVVPVERARNFSPKTVRHLAQNSQYIKDIDRDGMVIPTKVLSIRREDFYGIYENRFIKTLINRIHSFIKRRYDIIVDNAESFVNDQLEVISTYNIENEALNITDEMGRPKPGNYQEVSLRLDINVKSELKDEKVKEKNNRLLERINNLYRIAKGFKMSQFMKEMEKYSEVMPPIQKTNIILKNVNYQSCHKLWLFLDRYTALGFDAETDEQILSLGNNYLSDIYSLILLSYVTTQANELKRTENYLDVDYHRRLIKKPELELPDGFQLLFENEEVNDHFLNQSLVNYTEMYNRLLDEGKKPKEALDAVLMSIYQLIDTSAKNFYKVTDDPALVLSEYFNPKNLDIDEQISIMKDKTEVLNRTIKIKEADVQKSKKERDRYLKQIKKLEKTKADREAKKRKQMEIAKAKAELLKEYKRQVAEEQERQRKLYEKIAREERAKEAKRLKALMKKEKEKERLKQKEMKETSKSKAKTKKDTKVEE
jgi:hypothetical protein